MVWKRGVVPQSVYRRRLAVRLKQLRENANLTLTEAAHTVEINQGSLSRIESGERGTSPLLVKALLDCYGVQEKQAREDILDLVRADAAQRRPWWKKYAAVVSGTPYDGFLALESSAVALHSYEPLIIPGLLQTEDYARAVITDMRADLGLREVESLVEVRMARQASRLEGETPTTLVAVIDEAAVRRCVGSSAVMREQLEKLLESNDRPNVTCQLLPFEAGGHPGLYGPFLLMRFSEPNPDVVWVENLTGSVYVDNPNDVVRYTDVFDRIQARALEPADTRARIEQIIKELK